MAHFTHDNPAQLVAENAALRRELARYERIFTQLDLGVIVYRLEDRDDDTTFSIVAANPAVEAQAGVSSGDLVGRSLDEAFPTLRDQGLPKAYAQALHTGTPFVSEVIHGDEGAVEVAFDVRALPLPNDELAVIFDNTTARRQAELAHRRISAELEGRVAERTAALERSKALLQHLLDSSPSAIYLKDLEGRFLLVNQQAAAVMGRAPEELMGRADHELFPAEYVELWRAAEREVRRTGARIDQEETAPQPDGVHTFLSSRAPVFDERGELYAISGISTDITERTRAEEALRQSQHRLQTIIDSLPSAVFWKDRDSIYQGCNLTFARFAGVATPAEIVGKSDHDLPWAGAEAESYQAYDRKVMDAGVAELHIVETQLHADGKQSWADTNKIPLRGRDGAVVGILGTYEDITEQKRTEDALRASQALLATIFDHMPVAVILQDAVEDRFVLWNDAAERLYGPSAANVLGKTAHEVMPKDLADALVARDRAVIASRQPDFVPETQYDSPHRGPITVSTTRVPIFGGDGEPSHLLVICDDLTERKQAADERAALQAQIIEAQQHALRELSTPLLPISSNVVLMPIVGAIDSRRAQQVMEALLEGVPAFNAEIAIVDITGVQVVDTQVANAFIQAARAVQLLGAQVVLTGIRPEVAQTLVQLGVDLQGMLTRGSLQSGIAYALRLNAAA